MTWFQQLYLDAPPWLWQAWIAAFVLAALFLGMVGFVSVADRLDQWFRRRTENDEVEAHNRRVRQELAERREAERKGRE